MRRALLISLMGLSLSFGLSAASRAASPWPDTYQGRVEALAALESLNGALLASRSATLTLEAWCADHHLAQPARISAQRVAGPDKPITAAQRQDLQVGPDEPIRYRHVRLTCGEHVLSDADNWYVPSRLRPEMNRLLDTTDTPFGRVVLPLTPTRQTLSAERLWSPLPDHWDQMTPPPRQTGATTALAIPDFIFRHRALVFDSQRRPFSEVIETYTSETLSFARPPEP